MTRSIIHILPLELIIKIFMMLDYRSLLTCQQVCHLFNTLIAGSSPLQYALELAIAGKQDNPLSSFDFSHKLAALRRYQDAWGTLQWTNTKDIPMLRGNVWELYGGVLALSDLNRTIRFRRLPSQIREIEEHVWSVSTSDMDLRDFTIDPAQDLLVLIARPRRHRALDTRLETAVHLRSLTTGSRHPLAPDPSILRHSINEGVVELSFIVQVCEDCVAVHFISHEAAPSELVVWNWKTGRKELNLRSPNLKAISFLTNHYMLVGGFGDGDRFTEALLYVLDLTKCDGEPVTLEDVNYRCAFVYPPCFPWVTPLGFQIRADPMSPWVPPASSNVPFSVDRDLRLLVITMYVAFGQELVSFDLFVLSRALLSFVEGLGPENDRHDFSWKDWGPRNTRLMESPPHSPVWVCFVFGTKFASLVHGEFEANVHTLEVWDFNPNGIRRERCRGMVDEMEVEDDPIIEWHDHDFSLVHHVVFLENIQTSLPYRVVRRDLPLQKLGGRGFADVLCSEDNLILVDV
ncbi:hypothetical protein EDD16DRAFT_1619560 [Pisolithus croceorrhizus]|nr:hypothetical protein EDD16DRAFT_1619560 [Pisolithus croceorrhizus]KAI6119820.1 hypothetical protein EV401DRAFT_2263470 [Pisolithus croceorrhizus]